MCCVDVPDNLTGEKQYYPTLGLPVGQPLCQLDSGSPLLGRGWKATSHCRGVSGDWKGKEHKGSKQDLPSPPVDHWYSGELVSVW